MDFIETDSIYDLNPKQLHFDLDKYYQLNNTIKDQYINLNNLGVNFLSDDEYPDDVMSMVLNELLDYTHEHITPILEFEHTIELGKTIYEFVCVDCFNTIVPAFLEANNLYSYDSFELYFNKKLKGNVNYFKANFAKAIQNIIINLRKLEVLDKKIINDSDYNNLLDRYEFYLNLINFGNSASFIENYFVPLLAKNEYEIISKIA
jgi:hypothetical protein